MERAMTVYFNGTETAERNYKAHCASFMESQSASWNEAAFLVKQAVGIAVYQHKTGPLSYLLDIVLQGSKYRAACVKLIKAFFYGIEKAGEKYILNDGPALKREKATGLYYMPQGATIEGFKTALETLGFTHKQCGAQMAAVESAITRKAAPQKQWTIEAVKADIVKRYAAFASEQDKAAIQQWMAQLLK